MENQNFDVAIVGGGLAGLSQAILLQRAGHSVVVFEKNQYPFHRVCGEYISNESRNFLHRLGVPLHEFSLPDINQLTISAPQGFSVSSPLGLGGFGISRYLLDHQLFLVAQSEGVTVLQDTKVTGLIYENEQYRIQSTRGQFLSRIALGSYGKYEPSFAEPSMASKASPFIAVKYHIKFDHDPGEIALHNFKNGYCGISRVENGISCLCYLTDADNLKSSENQIRQMEEKVLFKNPHLKSIFENAQFLFDKPLTISQISFHPKARSKGKMLLLGDAAGTIAPLAGNGMSLALHSSFILAPLAHQFLKGKLTEIELFQTFDEIWKSRFYNRILWGYRLQQLFGHPFTTLGALRVVSLYPPLFRKLIGLTHGNPF